MNLFDDVVAVDKIIVRKNHTLGPAYNEFGYYEHPAITNNLFLLRKEHL